MGLKPASGSLSCRRQRLSSRKKNILVIGAGHWGKNLIRVYFDLGRLAAVCDSDENALKSIQGKYPGIQWFGDVKRAIKQECIEAVVIATNASTHASLVALALLNGKDVFVEKPICLDLGDGENLKRLAEENQLVLMVGHLLLYHPAFIKASEFVRSGALGELRYLYSNRLSFGKIRREETALWSFAPHDISMILDLVGSSPTSVTGFGGEYLLHGIEDTTLCCMTWKNSIVKAHIFVSWLHPYKDQRLVMVGSKGMLVFNDVVENSEKLLLYPHQAGWDFKKLPALTKAEAQPIEFDEAEPLYQECLHFLECIESRARPKTCVDEGLRVLSVLQACQQALATGSSAQIES